LPIARLSYKVVTGGPDSLCEPETTSVAFDLAAAFAHRQTVLQHALGYDDIQLATNPTVLGNDSRIEWAAMLNSLLPNRYTAGPAVAVDSTGHTSELIDLAIYDTHYSPLWFQTYAGIRVVPAESLYAAFRILPDFFHHSHLGPAGKMLASVRGRVRTSVPVVTAQGLVDRVNPDDRPILGGVLAALAQKEDCRELLDALAALTGPEAVDIGIVLDSAFFERADGSAGFRIEHGSAQLIAFCERLFQRLQQHGSVVALDIVAYAHPSTASSRTRGAMSSNRFDMERAFKARQEALEYELRLTSAFVTHSGEIGDGSEELWRRMLRAFLPARYRVDKVFVVDSEGGQSEQIDLAIYDGQYSPLWFESASGTRIIPAESVYAVFEIKQRLDSDHLKYTSKKVGSVRKLKRKPAPVVDVAGWHPPVDVRDRPIIGGLLALRNTYTTFVPEENIAKYSEEDRIDLGLALCRDGNVEKSGVFIEIDHPATHAVYCRDRIPGLRAACPHTLEDRPRVLQDNSSKMQLIKFCLSLFRRLQQIGTASAVDIDAYAEVLYKNSPNTRVDPQDR
jgi:hypothetical protein